MAVQPKLNFETLTKKNKKMREAKDILASKLTIDNEFGLESSLPEILEAMDEYREDLKQSRDTWEDIAQNCRKDLEAQVEAIVELRANNKNLIKILTAIADFEYDGTSAEDYAKDKLIELGIENNEQDYLNKIL